jgi:hypothetical protein
MSSAERGVQRTLLRRSSGLLLMGVLAVLIAAGGVAANQQPAAAATKKVVIVVGATGSTTSYYRSIARSLAHQARSYGAYVVQVYSPRATWSRVRSAARGANLLVYLGHGNGWPSRYAPFQTHTKDGMGLNRSLSGSDYNTDYYGEAYMRSSIRLARNGVVLLLHLCYAAGSSPTDDPTPPLWKAEARVDNYGAGFLRTGAKAVFADGLDNGHSVLYGLFKTNRTMRQIFWSSPLAKGRWAASWNPRRSPWWARAIVDPYSRQHYYRSVVGNLSMRASAWR